MQLWRTFCYFQFFLLLSAFIFLGLTPSPEKAVPMFNDKLMHCTGYFVAAFSISFAFPLRKLHWRAIFLIVFSIGIEIAQYLMPPRTFDIVDILANTSGALIGLNVLTLLSKYISFVRHMMFWSHRI